MPPLRCQYCGKPFQTSRAVNHHISLSKSCSIEHRNDLFRNDDPSPSPSPKKLKKKSSTELKGELDGYLNAFEDEMGNGDDFVMPSPPRGASANDDEGEGVGGNTNPGSDYVRFIESYAGDAGKGLRKSQTEFDVWLENQSKEEKIAWFPFASEQEWDLSKWLIKNVGQKSTDEFLKLAIVREASLPFHRKEVLTE
jgi:hypothetical protein